MSSVFTKRVGEIKTVALDFADELAEGERIIEILSVEVLRPAELVWQEADVREGDQAGYFLIQDSRRQEFAYTAGSDVRLIFALRGTLEPTHELVVSRYGQGQGPQESCVIATLGQWDDENQVVVGGGMPNKKYVIRATVRKEFGDVSQLEDEIEVTA